MIGGNGYWTPCRPNFKRVQETIFAVAYGRKRVATILERTGIVPSEPIETNTENLWRLGTPGGSEHWGHSPYPRAEKKYFMISCDTHLGVPGTLFRDRIDE